jgi:RNA polymerase sigma factor (sigma-70 family)
MQRCRKCREWNKGRGTRACLRCQVYKNVQLQSVKRPPIRLDVYPDEILESFPDEIDHRDFLDFFRLLPPLYSVILSARYLVGLTIDETADLLHLSPRSVSRACQRAVGKLRSLRLRV